jgi:TRAP-type C4-dicarboxylate transport system permease small subunit
METLIKVMEKVISILASAAMAAIVLVVFANVFMRYVLNTGLTWSDEVSVDLFVWFIFLGGILAALDGLHLKVDVLTNRLSPKLQRLFAFIAECFTLASMAILFIGGLAQVDVTSKNISAATGLPSSYITISMVIFAGAVIILTIYNILHIIQGKELVGQRKEAEQK